MAEGPERSLLHVHAGLGCAHNFETEGPRHLSLPSVGSHVISRPPNMVYCLTVTILASSRWMVRLSARPCGRPVAHTEAKCFSPPTIDRSLLARWSLKGGQSVENLRGLATADAKPASRVRPKRSANPQTTAHYPLPLRRRPTVGTQTRANRTCSENLADKRPSDRRPQGSSEAVPPVRHYSLGTASDQPLSPASALENSVPLLSLPSPLVPASACTSDVRVLPPPTPAGEWHVDHVGKK
jgi:hypothetical protein